ncbi:hypothetical protein HZS_2943 [Henneguya salminicola]|nr:hypothetical protein HZS_2943 [Henneguya salminicola]
MISTFNFSNTEQFSEIFKNGTITHGRVIFVLTLCCFIVSLLSAIIMTWNYVNRRKNCKIPTEKELLISEGSNSSDLGFMTNSKIYNFRNLNGEFKWAYLTKIKKYTKEGYFYEPFVTKECGKKNIFILEINGNLSFRNIICHKLRNLLIELN